MNTQYEDLYDYDTLRKLEEPSAFIVRIDEPFVVLGGSQPDDVLRPDIADFHPVRRRRGGGGVVLLQPDDLWIDWWIPASDPRVSDDVRRNALLPGEWWYRSMVHFLPSAPAIVGDGLTGPKELRTACFATSGPGELFYEDRKLVGVTQWHIREGIFLSTLLPARSIAALENLLAEQPIGMTEALAGIHTLESLNLMPEAESIVDRVLQASGVTSRRHLMLMA